MVSVTPPRRLRRTGEAPTAREALGPPCQPKRPSARHAKPWSVSAVSDLMGKKRRALVLSVDNLIQTTLEFCFAPVVGYVADTLSIEAVFLLFGAGFLVINAAVLGGGWGTRDAPLL